MDQVKVMLLFAVLVAATVCGVGVFTIAAILEHLVESGAIQ